MSKFAGTMYHPSTTQPEHVFEGFSWPCLFWGVLWYMVKGMWKWVVISLVVSLLTGGLAWFIFPFMNNKQFTKHLIVKGYLPNDTTKKYFISKGLITEAYPSAKS